MDHPAYQKLAEYAREPEALEATIAYIADNLRFLSKKETVLICFPKRGTDSLGGLFEEAVLRCDAFPILWDGDYRWKSLLRLAFSSRASTIIGPPLIILGLTKLARANGTPLRIRNVVTAGYPCMDWMIDGIIKGLDCNTWGCFGPGTDAVVGGFSCGKSRGVHLRDDVYGIDIVDKEGNVVPDGEIGEMVMYALGDPQIRYPTAEHARIEREPCPCGRTSLRLMDMGPGDSFDPDLTALGEYLHSWSSVLDCRMEKGVGGLELEMITFPGERLPKLPTCAKLIVRPWDPESDAPFQYMPRVMIPGFSVENH